MDAVAMGDEAAEENAGSRRGIFARQETAKVHKTHREFFVELHEALEACRLVRGLLDSWKVARIRAWSGIGSGE